jgi:hypothetical protein
MKTILHFLFMISVIIIMFSILIPAVVTYMFVGINLIEEIRLEAAKIERKYFS